jgi:hypothetical protein
MSVGVVGRGRTVAGEIRYLSLPSPELRTFAGKGALMKVADLRPSRTLLWRGLWEKSGVCGCWCGDRRGRRGGEGRKRRRVIYSPSTEQELSALHAMASN